MTRKVLLLWFPLLVAPVARAQFGRSGAEWVTNGADAQRSHSIPNDPSISVQSLQKQGFQFLWKNKLNNDAVQLNSLTPAIFIDRYIGYRGFRSYAFVAGSSNTVYAIDSDLNRIDWRTKLPGPPLAAGSVNCPGGITSPIARATTVEYPVPGTFGGLGGRAGPARSGVGDPNEGAVTIPAVLAAARAAAGAPGRGPLRIPGLLYVLAGDGTLHTLYISNGVEPQPAINFLPPNANAQGLVVIEGVAYAATQNCNGAPSGIWALDIASKQVGSWKPTSGAIAGSAGPAFGPDGTVYAATTSGELVALDPKTLMVKARYHAGQEFTSSVLVFQYKNRDVVAAATRDGRIHVLDSASLREPIAKSAPYSANFAPGALASWQSSDGVRWLLAAVRGTPATDSGFSGSVTNGAVAAWKLVDHNGTAALDPGWLSRDLVSPLTPMVLNGVIMAVSSGEYRSDDTKLTATERAKRSSPAVLYALDGSSGKALWDSGKTITSFVHSGGISGQAGQVYLETYDQTMYAFGFPIEH